MKLAALILRIFGWKIENSLEGKIPKKAVIIAAPHTSLWDFPLGYVAYKAMGIDAHYLVKKEAFFFPFGILLRKMGGIAVDRFVKNTVVDDVVELFNQSSDFILTITPEATRSPVKEWKDGFHRIAKNANVPLIIGFMDFKRKCVGVSQVFPLTDDSQTDILNIMKIYVGMEGKHPEKFYLPPEVL